MRARIERGEWGRSEQLPVLSELAAHYEVSAATVAKVLRELRDEGLLVIVPRWGVFRA